MTVKIRLKSPSTSEKHFPRIHVVSADGIYFARRLAAQNVRATLLNFANNDVPGGPTEGRGNTQEEQIFRVTNAAELLDKKLYPIDDAEGPALLHTEGLTFCMSECKGGTINMITCAAVKLPQIAARDGGRYYRLEEQERLTELKMCGILQTCTTSILLLGAWGLGAFSNPLDGIVQLWERALKSGCTSPKVTDVVFAILPPVDGEDDSVFKAFKRLE